jgi:hypothetical protein
MINKLYNTVTQTLSRGLTVIGILSMLVGFGFTGKGVIAEAAVTIGFKITYKEALSNLLGGGKCVGTTDQNIKNVSTDLNVYLNWGGPEGKELLNGCVYGQLGNGYGKSGNPEARAKLTGCELVIKNGGRDLFCTKAVDNIDGNEYKGTHWKFDSVSCTLKIPSSEGVHYCTEKQQGKSQQCYYADGSSKNNGVSNTFTICDSGENGGRTQVGTSADDTKVFKDKGWACTFFINSDANLNRATYGSWACTKDDLSKVAIPGDSPENVCNLFNLNGVKEPILNCDPGKIQFKDGVSKFWTGTGMSINSYKSGLSDFIVEREDKSFYRLTDTDIIKNCKLSVDQPETFISEFSGDQAISNCKNVTKTEFFGAVKAECDKQLAQNPNAKCNSKPGESADREGVANSANGQSNAEKKAKVGNIAGDAFTLIYRIIAMIIFALLFVVRYFQTFILLAFISIMTVLLNLSPNTSFLTQLAVPLWGIFAQIANLGAVFVLIYLGSATMIGIMKYDEAIKKGTQVALYTFVSSFTYFGLAFVISLLDGFTKLIVYVFGGGSIFKLFEALLSSVSSISTIGYVGLNLVPDVGALANGIGKFGQGGTPEITTNLVSEIIVVVGLTLILIVFKNIFFMLLTRVAILLLLLITSPMWVLGYLVKDSLPGDLKGQMEKAVTLTFNSIVFNFAFILTLVLVTIITQKINDGTAAFITNSGVSNFFLPQTNSGLALLDPVTASAQQLSDSNFSSFGAGFTKTISVCTVLAMNLVIIQQAFKFVETLIDDSIVKAGQAVGGAVSKNLQNFRKTESFKQGIGMLGKDLYSGATKAITGDNQLIKDAGGAGVKGLNFAGKGVVGANRYIRDADGKNAESRRNFNASLKGNALGAVNGFRNPGKTLASLNNTIQDRLGVSGRIVNQDMIDDYNNKKLKNGGKTLTIEEELRQKERLQIAAKFEEEERDKAQKAGDKNLETAKASTDPAIVAQVTALEGSEAALAASTKALQDVSTKLTENEGNLKAFQAANGYTDTTDMVDVKPEDVQILNKLRNDKINLTTEKTTNEALVSTNQQTYDTNLTNIRGKINDDLVNVSSANLSSHLKALDNTNNEGIDAAITKAKKIGKRSFAGNINRYTENAEKIGDDIDDMARGGKANTKFATDQDFQSALIKQLEELKKTQGNNTPPPGP